MAEWRYPEARLLIFAKAPIPGQCKTRLASVLTGEQAAMLQSRLIRHTVLQQVERALCPIELWCSPDSDHGVFHDLAAGHGVALRVQQGNDLGERMVYAMQHRPSAMQVVIGTDCPVLGHAQVAAALAHLARGDDAVFAPAEDGGYVLVATRTPRPELFDGVTWGSERVMAETRERLRALDWRWAELETLWDVDRPEDWQRLGNSPSLEHLARG